MIKGYFKIAWRNLKKNRLYAFINIAGLTIGIVSCLLIGIYIKHELSYDRFNEKADRIVRVTMDYDLGGSPQKVAVTGTKPGPQFKRTFPSIKDFARVQKRTNVIAGNGKQFEENNILYADPSFLNLFSFQLLNGSPSSLNAPDKIILTQTTAKKYFDNVNPLGKVLKIDDRNFVVSGVAADAPSNSQIKFDFIISFDALNASKEEDWWSANSITYLLLNSNDDLLPLQKLITSYMQAIDKGELKMTPGQYMTYLLEPLTSVHLHSSHAGGLEPGGSITYIYILTIVALLILIIACVNYINLSIVQSAGRGSEIGIRKVMGAVKNQLFGQFIGESLFVTGISILLAFGLAIALLPFLNQISGKELQTNALTDSVILMGLIILGIIIGFAAGAYPALILSNVKLIKILKAGFSFTSGQNVRRSLITFQFIISIFLIISTIVILQQLSFIRSKDVGYNKSNVVMLPVSYQIVTQIGAIKKAIANIPGVESVAAANNEPVNVEWGDGITAPGGKSLTVNALPMDEDFIRTMQIKIIAGSNFSHTDALLMDTTNRGKNFRYMFMLNETAVKALGWTSEEAIGKEISKGGTPGTIKAVVRDFNFKSFHDQIGPLLIFLDYDQTGAIFARINGSNTTSTLERIRQIWKSRFPEKPFKYSFLDDDYNALYNTEQRTVGVFTTFSTIAILLACLGLFAVTAFSVTQRKKEISIRKVLGANISGIVILVSKDFLLLVIIATVVASPIAWFASQNWLRDFAYRIDIHWWIFVVAGVASLIVAGIAVSVQAWKAAIVNPVNSLRSE